MARSTLLVIYLMGIFAYNLVNSATSGDISEKYEIQNLVASVNASTPKIMIKTIKESRNFSKSVQNNDILSNLVQASSRILLQPRIEIPRATIIYKLGNRVSGDRVVASTLANQQWNVSQNVTQNLSYPRTGIGAIITYVEIIVDQNSHLGKGFVNMGGIGQRQIAITIEAQKTLIFRQNTLIYGY